MGWKVALNLTWVLVWEVGKTEGKGVWRSRKPIGRVLRRAEPPLASRPGLPASQDKQDMARLCRHHPPTGHIPHRNGTWCIKGRHAWPWVPVCHITPHQRVSRASLPRRREPLVPLCPETGSFDQRHPRMCSKGCGGRESSWEPDGGCRPVHLSADREGSPGRGAV